MGIFLFAGIFSLAIIFLVKHPDLLQASVLNATEISLIKNNQRDIAYKQNENLLDIFFSNSVSKFPITIVLNHSNEVLFDMQNISWQCPFTIFDSNQETTVISIDCLTFDYNQSILLIPFNWKTQDVLVEEAYYINWNKKNLSIGNISIQTEHSK